MHEFGNAVATLLKLESEAAATARTKYDLAFLNPEQVKNAIRNEASKAGDYQQVRATVSKGVLRAASIAEKLGVPIVYQSFPPPMIGGPVITANLFHSVLHDPSWGGTDRQLVFDALNETIGELEARLQKELRQLINPIYWIKELLVLIIRIPFIIIEASGFDVHKIEDHLFGKLFKVLEIVALVYLVVRMGLTPDQIRDIILKLIP